ncbi:hypothetical protein J4Q44_G00246720 [Coregonus suidteri]|uniref:CxC2-like cysteine cluster KDZ transposase-associated domain-containing protein n=1 Tax=Coregonus suidteri TaxID=861788 RepID=A0AAN8QM50_9TELE
MQSKKRNVLFSGRAHDVWLEFCSCELEPVTLIRYRLWPATPHLPQTAISVDLLRQFAALQLECGVSLRGITLAFHKSNACWKTVELYRKLTNESFEEFKHWQFKRETVRKLPPLTSDGTKCPLCPQENGHQIIAADALFGLPRKISSGTSIEGPKHAGRFFCDQDKVDCFVGGASDTPTEGCLGFRAGDALRSKTQKLHITGVLGMACRHEHPLKFLNLKRGEKLANPVFLLGDLKAMSLMVPGM